MLPHGWERAISLAECCGFSCFFSYSPGMKSGYSCWFCEWLKQYSWGPLLDGSGRLQAPLFFSRGKAVLSHQACRAKSRLQGSCNVLEPCFVETREVSRGLKSDTTSHLGSSPGHGYAMEPPGMPLRGRASMQLSLVLLMQVPCRTPLFHDA